MKSNQSPLIPPLTPVYGAGRLWELEDDDAYLKYLYPQITRQISEFVEEVCDQMEHEGSLMFDQYPDRTALQILASGIEKDFRKKYPDSYSREDSLLRDMIEVVLFHEIMHRRYRYREPPAPLSVIKPDNRGGQRGPPILLHNKLHLFIRAGRFQLNDNKRIRRCLFHHCPLFRSGQCGIQVQNIPLGI